MAIKQQQENLGRLLAGIRSRGTTRTDPIEAVRVARTLPWAHSTSRLGFRAICRARGLTPGTHPARSVEAKIGTKGCVFFYVGTFQYPSTDCGVLLRPWPEGRLSSFEAAAPFDTGGLVHHFRRPTGSGTARRFRELHDLPAPGYRQYLAELLSRGFERAGDYLDGTGPLPPDPHGLQTTGADNPRRWTFEYRRKGRVSLNSHLIAVFVTRAATAHREVKTLLAWCMREGIHWEPFTGGRKGCFDQLQRTARAYLQKVCGA